MASLGRRTFSVQRPLAALDLHYLIICYGADAALEPQRLLGRAGGRRALAGRRRLGGDYGGRRRWDMQQRAFGDTGLTVSAVGLGAGQVGERWVDDASAERLLNQALDLGITLIDTARDYGTSEERIGRYLSHRRDEFVLSTKVGHSVHGYQNWSREAIRVGLEDARRKLRSDVLDVVHLHSCSLEVLQKGEAIEALEEARDRGWVRFMAYSGDNEALAWAVDSGRFQSVQFSVNICDQRVIDTSLPAAAERGLGVIAKRPIANGPWRFAERPVGKYVEPYWERWRKIQPDLRGLPPDEVALRFTAFLPGISAVIAGTSNPENLARNVEALSKGPLDPDHVAALRAAFAAADPGDWIAKS
jgi:aryl-alcohol dehydrogenase-like predicted oxidoreductase